MLSALVNLDLSEALNFKFGDHQGHEPDNRIAVVRFGSFRFPLLAGSQTTP